MKKILRRIVPLYFLNASPVLAACTDPDLCPDKPATNVPENLLGVDGAITTVSNTILLIVGALAVLFLIIGGVQYISSAGNPDSVGKAKNTILYAIIGIVVAILGYAIVNFVIGNLT